MKRIVIKVGSHVLTEDGKIALDRLEGLVELIAKLQKSGKELILVSSGAVAAGYTKISTLDRSKVEQKQALAAIGQPFLLKQYQKAFNRYDILTAQILLTADDFDSRKRTEYAKRAVETLLENTIVPIVNENDVTATEELLFGDNDRLSAHVAYYFDADILAILSDIDAYYTSDPRKNDSAKPRAVVEELKREELEEKCTPNGAFATGGIVTKLKSAHFLLKRDKKMFLATGFGLDDIRSFLIDGVQKGGTLFL
jgi:glutamate 5-kinase